MKIVIALILLALLFFLFRKFFGGSGAAPTGNAPVAPEDTAPASTDTGGRDAAAAGVAAVAAAAVTSAAGASTAAPAQPKRGASAPAVEHLLGVDRRIGKSLRAQGISDIAQLRHASADTLTAAGIDPRSAANLRAQAALSAIPGIAPQEVAALANGGVDSIETLTQRSADELLGAIARANRATGALKSPLGVQQLTRLIASAKTAL